LFNENPSLGKSEKPLRPLCGKKLKPAAGGGQEEKKRLRTMSIVDDGGIMLMETCRRQTGSGKEVVACSHIPMVISIL